MLLGSTEVPLFAYEKTRHASRQRPILSRRGRLKHLINLPQDTPLRAFLDRLCIGVIGWALALGCFGAE